MINFKVEEISGKSYDCECCGCYSASGTRVYVNDEMVWEKYFDGHMGGNQTEDSLLNTVLQAWYEQTVYEIELKYSEQSRAQWKKDKPGSSVADHIDSWTEYKAPELKYLKENFDTIKKHCEELPYDELIQVKMIALWIEAEHGYAVNVEQGSFYEG